MTVMKLDRSKATFWLVGILLLASVLVFRSERKEPIKLPPPPVAEVVAPAPPAVVPPPTVVLPAPPVTAPVTKARPQHRSTPAPAPVVKSKPRVKTKCGECGSKPAAKRKRLRDCHLVPPEAYQHSEFLVVGAARQRGIDENGIALLKACLKQHAGGGG